MHVGDELVSRRCTSRGKPLPIKLSEDVCSLVHCLKNDLPAPRCIIKMESVTEHICNPHGLILKANLYSPPNLLKILSRCCLLEESN